jgi:RNA polymerase sigma-70 factor, ECF subfamily
MSQSSARSSLGIPRAFSAEESPVSRDRASDERLSRAVERYFAVVWRSLRRFGVPESVADDAAQHVFLTFAARMGAVDVDSERPFLVSSAVRVAANVRRQLERTREVPLLDLEPELAVEASPERLLEEKRRRVVLDQALAALPFDQRTVFVLFELEGFTLPEIAESLHVPLGTATSRLRRARERFEAWVLSHDAKGDDP